MFEVCLLHGTLTPTTETTVPLTEETLQIIVWTNLSCANVARGLLSSDVLFTRL
jgi:hypothetical protein